jgi:mannose/fructose-specific phosphotransferase system component IIA
MLNKMTQIYEKVMVKKVEKIEETESQDVELLGDLNPKYFEEVIRLEEAKERIRASDIFAGSKFNFFSAF